MELYIHIPFCVKKCDYCDFLSFAADEQTQKSYVAALQKELAFYGAKYKDRRITTIFIGGGTPSWLKEDYMQAIMETVYHYFSVEQDAEITIECNPGTVTEHKFEVYRKIGINRLSIGLQSAHNDELKILGRIHTYEQFLKTYDMARKHGFTNINIDLMSSLPGQTPDIFCDSLHRVLQLKPEHISAYSLIIEKGTPFYDLYKFDAVRQEAGMQTESLPTEEEEYQTTKMTQHILKEAGYHWYEVSNFAKPGYECKHNMVYWTGGEYIGFGIGASSYFQGKRFNNMRDIFKYIELMENLSDKFVETDNMEILYNDTTRTLRENVTNIYIDARMEEFMFLGLRMTCGVSREDFKERFNKDIYEVYGSVLNKYIGEGFMASEGDRIYLTDAGIDVSNVILADFLLDS